MKSIGLAVLLAANLGAAGVAAAADTCYRDDSGRIVHRRLPRSVEVPCPKATTPSGAESGTATGGEADIYKLPGAFKSGTTFERGPRPAASPVPRPGLEDYVQSVPVPDRWRIVDALGYPQNLFDPYNRNVLKGDKPVHNGDWFFSVTAFSDSLFQSRNVVQPVGSQSTDQPGSDDVFGRTRQTVFVQTVGAEFVYYKGDTVFKPPEYEFRFTPVFNFNHVNLGEVLGVNIDPRKGRSRNDHHVGIQAAFVDKHLRNVDERFDFDSFRIGIQPFSADFRGFLFQDNQLGARLFGIRENNRYQYNLAYFRRIEKDTNSGLNDLGQSLRKDDVIVANLYRQDTLISGFTAQGTVVYNRNRESDKVHYDNNGFISRPAALGREVPRDYDVVYLGLNGDGHFDRWNLTTSFYYALGKDKPGNFVASDVDIRAFFAAFEVSRDFDWIRARASLLYGSGDKDPFDKKATGFDAISQNLLFAGADSSYWIRQAVPLVGGGGVTLSGPNSVLNNLRSSADEGQSNFTNPGIILAGVGVDMDVLPTLRLSFNVNDLNFADTKVLEVARNQGGLSKHIGEDVSASLIYRPFMTQNIVLRTSYAKLFTGNGYGALFPKTNPGYFMFNAIFTY
jgi:hypothetical protein